MSNPFASWRIEDVERQNAKAAGRSLVAPPSTSKAVERERDLHDDIEALCKSRGYLYRHDRMDKPTTGQVGFPDFAIFMPGALCCFLECKAKGRKATTEQLAKLAHARKLGFVAEIVDNYEDAKAVLARAEASLEHMMDRRLRRSPNGSKASLAGPVPSWANGTGKG